VAYLHHATEVCSNGNHSVIASLFGNEHGSAMSTLISEEEFSERRRRATDLARRKGLDALLVCSRGGGTLDRFADVFYLTNYYSQFPFIPDYDGNWSARAHSFLILPSETQPHLIIDVPDDGSRIRLGNGKITHSELVIESTIDALKNVGLERARVGLIGVDVLPYAWTQRIASALPNLMLEPADGILRGLRSLKSPSEIKLLQQASQLGSRMIEAMLAAAVPGASHGEILATGLGVIVRAGGMLYNSFMASGSGGTTPKLVKSSFPTWGSPTRLEKGDWIRFGVSGMLDGYIFDLARAKAVGAASSRQIEVFEAALASVEASIAAIRPGATAQDLARAGLEKQLALGFDIKGVFSAMGHGVGLGWDDPWLTVGDSTNIVPGMVLSIERTLFKDGYIGDLEEMVLVSDKGAEKLTDAPQRHW
jgi:Xaa-Pro aminopeptidase